MEKKKLIELLQADLTREYTAMNFYLQSSFTVRGYRRGYLKGWLRDQANEELGHAIQIADKIASLGATPAGLIPEAKGLTDAVAVVRTALSYETEVVKAFTQRIKDAEAFGDIQLRLLLEEQLAQSQEDAEELAKLLAT